jgi:hypothetical protein
MGGSMEANRPVSADPRGRTKQRRNRMRIITKYEAADTAERATAWELVDA